MKIVITCEQVKTSLSAIKLSQYREQLKKSVGIHWDKDRYSKIFKAYTGTDDPKAYRIYLPLVKEVEVPKIVENALKEKGFTIINYKEGYCIKPSSPKNKTNIGKILSKYPEAKKIFDQDRSKIKELQNESDANLLVCISRHPYDIAGMSTDRNWKSCMNLGGGKTWSEIGCRTRQIPIELQKGILVAYLIKDNDKNIKDPISRISIKPYIHEKDPDSMIFGMSNKIFGKKNLKFQTVVRNWVNSVNKKFFNKSGTYILAEGLYRDSKQGEDDIRTMD